MSKVTDSIQKNAGGFSLLELLIVILLAGIMAFLIGSVYRQKRSAEASPSIEHLKPLLFDKGSKNRRLICIDGCRHCFFAEPGGAMEPAPFALPPLRAYGVDTSAQPYRLHFGRYQDHPICLRFNAYADGHTSRMILEAGKSFYYLPAYFGKIERYPSLEDAVARWNRDKDLLNSRWDYY